MNKFRSLENKIRDVFAGKGEASTYYSFRTAIKMVAEKVKHRIEQHATDQIVAGTYHTKHFEMCPSAQKLYVNMPKHVDPGDAEQGAILQDKLFALEKAVVAKNRATQADVDQANELYNKIMHFAKKMKLEAQHDKYLKMHVGTIEGHLKPDTPEVGADDTGKSRFKHRPYEETMEVPDQDIDNTKFKISRFIKAQRKLKIIDND